MSPNAFTDLIPLHPWVSMSVIPKSAAFILTFLILPETRQRSLKHTTHTQTDAAFLTTFIKNNAHASFSESCLMEEPV